MTRDDFIDKLLKEEGDRPADQRWQQGIYGYAKSSGVDEGEAIDLSMELHVAATVYANGGPLYTYGVTRGTILRLARMELTRKEKRGRDAAIARQLR